VSGALRVRQASGVTPALTNNRGLALPVRAASRSSCSALLMAPSLRASARAARPSVVFIEYCEIGRIGESSEPVADASRREHLLAHVEGAHDASTLERPVELDDPDARDLRLRKED
jgi:hypothetical protein